MMLEKQFEVCAVKVKLDSKRLCIITIYRASIGNIDIFITNLDTKLRNLCSPSQVLIICGDININYLNDSEKKRKLDSLLKTYNLLSIVNFATKIQGNSATAIDNIFIDIMRKDYYYYYIIIIVITP
jgi:exonuclease III